MRKDERLVNTVKNLARRHHEQNVQEAISRTVSCVYSALAIAMYECEISQDDIEYLFARSQTIWGEHVGDIDSMITKCEEMTGIEIRGES